MNLSFYCIRCLGYVAGKIPPHIAMKPKGIDVCAKCGNAGVGFFIKIKEVQSGKEQDRREIKAQNQKARKG